MESIFSNVPGFKLYTWIRVFLLHACFPRHFRATTFRNISEELFQLFSQINFRMFLQDTMPYIFCVNCTPFFILSK